MTWTLPFLFIHFSVRSGIPVELAGVVLRVLLTFFLGCLMLFFMQVAARRYLLPLARLCPLEVTLKAERQVWKLGRTVRPKAVRAAHGSCRPDAADGKICFRLFQASLGACRGVRRRGFARARQEDSNRRGARQGRKPGGAVSAGSSCAESGAVVEGGGGPRAAQARGGQRRVDWASAHGQRRYVGPATGSEEQSQRGLSRSGAFRALAYGQGQRLALARRQGVGGTALGRAGVGLTLAHGVRSFGAFSSAAGAATQDLPGGGGAEEWAAPSLATGAGGGWGGRELLCRERIAQPGQGHARRELEHAVTVGGRPGRPRSCAAAPPTWAAPKKGARRPTLPPVLQNAPTRGTPLTVSKGEGGGGRERYGHDRMVSLRFTCGRRALGVESRSPGGL